MKKKGYCIHAYPRVLIKLVVFVIDVEKMNGDELLITLIVDPIGYACRNCDDVALSDTSNLLMAVFLLGAILALSLLTLSLLSLLTLPLMLRLLLRFFETLRATREYDS